MLDTIFVASLALSAKLHHYQPVTQAEISTAFTVETIAAGNKVFLAKGRPYKSRYRQEADNAHEEHDTHHRDREGRIHRDSDRYRQSDEYSRDRRERVYRDSDRYPESREYRRDRNDDGYYRQDRYENRYPSRDSRDSRDSRYRY